MRLITSLALLISVLSIKPAIAQTGVGVMVGNPYWGLELKHNSLRMNVSLDDNFGVGVNKVFGINNTPFYVFAGGHYVDRDKHNIALTPGIGVEINANPLGFYIDLGPSFYLDEMEFDWEARAGLRVYF
ncbi:hypothetical protein GT360_16635 [Vibrio astriarenae]|uniref:Outer membrane protein beta-barrel domain-containing protein n=1 Tax=Vibrio astriarenae TaxID=1481923 RepID=A0A7Z2YFI9_9VIBR|nr:hypothetical protein [Vibrio astriarenae]QIA65180.1 hypothetical protein GT360_16635 [Vibrio astriarenae]